MSVRFCGLVLALMLLPGATVLAADATCKTAECHASVGGTKNIHDPMKGGDCSACHKQANPTHPLKGGKSFTLTEKGAALCYQCHDAYGKKKIVHSPVKEGECAYCHKPHGGAERFLLEVGDDQTELCIGCHEAAEFKKKVKHGPVAVGACTTCHSPHESDEKNLLRGPVWERCLKCHTDFKKSLAESPVIHPPVKNGPCTSCHAPHSSEVGQLLVKKTPDLCFTCHKEMEKKLKTKLVHKPIQQEGGCSSCHSSHYSKSKGLFAAGDEVGLCLGCHNTNKLGSPPLKNIKKELDGKKNLHGPLKRGECKGCHDPHGSDNFRLLKGKYPAELYTSYKEGVYDLCLSCHDKNLLRFPDTTVYTKFRNGNRNLHYVHVVGMRKGRTCRVCHEPHASSGEKLISKEGTQFGDWKIPINFKTTPGGGSCAPGCHSKFAYDRDKPENYQPKEPR